MPEDEKKCGWTEEEERQMEEDRSGHPWQLTLAQFLERAERLYGFVFCEVNSGAAVLRYLKSPDGALLGLLPVGLALEEQLDAFTTASLCRHFRIPLEDFGLTGDELREEKVPN